MSEIKLKGRDMKGSLCLYHDRRCRNLNTGLDFCYKYRKKLTWEPRGMTVNILRLDECKKRANDE